MVDVYRRPARLGPRFPLWVRLLLVWAAMLVVYVLVLLILTPAYGATTRPPIDPPFVVLLLVIGLTASLVPVYTQLRFASDGSIVSSVLAARGTQIGNVEDTVRPSDLEERLARRRWKRGAITRREYERIIARRHFVHGEISQAEYHEIVRQLGESNPDGRRGARAPPGQV